MFIFFKVELISANIYFSASFVKKTVSFFLFMVLFCVISFLAITLIYSPWYPSSGNGDSLPLYS